MMWLRKCSVTMRNAYNILVVIPLGRR